MANLFPLSANTYFVTWITLFFFWRKYSTCISIEILFNYVVYFEFI